MSSAIFERFVSPGPDGRPIVVERMRAEAVAELVQLSPPMSCGRRLARWAGGVMAIVPAQPTPEELQAAYADAWLLLRLREAVEDIREAAAAVGAQRALRRARRGGH